MGSYTNPTLEAELPKRWRCLSCNQIVEDAWLHRDTEGHCSFMPT